jgi:hypothetical protein
VITSDWNGELIGECETQSGPEPGVELSDQQVIMAIISNWIDQNPELADHEYDNVTISSIANFSKAYALSIFNVYPIGKWS